MKLLEFEAIGVHGYLDFHIIFRADVNFIAGLNGSGKTTALNMIAALVTPSIDVLSKIQFKKTSLTILKDDGKIITISAAQADDTLVMHLDGPSPKDKGLLEVNIPEARYLERNIANKYRKNHLFNVICELPSPMYLSLDRRFIKEVNPLDSGAMTLGMVFQDKTTKETSSIDPGMKEALDLIFKKSAEIKDRQTIEDRKLRNKIILDSFHIGDSDNGGMHFPDRNSLAQLKSKQRTIKSALKNLDFKDDELEQMYDKFFDNLNNLLNNVLDVLNRNFNDFESTKKSAAAKSRGIESIPTKKGKISNQISLESSQVLGTWFANSYQIARIDRLIKLIREYESARDNIYQPLMKFVELVNSFLKQTNKVISVNNRGEVKITISEVERDLTILSSGERQILIMLAHLSLNTYLPKSGVFIVDEPELSLHIAWQDKFLEAVQAAGPELQIILATHSPAIIGGRREYYIPLNGGI